MTTAQPTSWSLIHRAAAGSLADRDAFALRYLPVVQTFFSARWKLPFDHDEVRDAAQEVFVECFKENGALGRADEGWPAGFRGFLYGVARKVGANIERHLANRREVAAHSAIRLAAIDHSDVAVSRAFDRAFARLIMDETSLLLAKRAVTGRRAAAADALKLRFQGGLKPSCIAAKLSVEVAVVYELLREAKQHYRAAFLEVMAVHHPQASETELKRQCVELMNHL